MLDNFFVGGSNSHKIDSILTNLANNCKTCLGKHQHFCLQKSCRFTPPFCFKCEGNIHTLHRVNEIKIVFINKKYLKSTQDQAKLYLQHLIQNLSHSKKICDKTGKLSIYMSKQLDSTLTIFQQKYRQLNKNNNLNQLIATVQQHIMKNRQNHRTFQGIKSQIRGNFIQHKINISQSFEQLFSQVDFTQKYKFEEDKVYMETIKNLHIYQTSIKQCSSCINKLYNGFQRQKYFNFCKKYFGQDLFTFLRQSHLNIYIINNKKMGISLGSQSMRSTILNHYHQKCIGRRLILHNNLFKQIPKQEDVIYPSYHEDRQYIKEFVRNSDALVELCDNTKELSDFSRELKCLFCYSQKKNMHKLPSNLRSLRMIINSNNLMRRNQSRQVFRQNIHIYNNEDYLVLNEPMQAVDHPQDEEVLDTYNLHPLVKLKYLVVLDTNIQPPEIRKLLFYAIFRKFHLLTILIRKGQRYPISIEDNSGTHMFPQLQTHCRIFRRRIIQCLVLARTAHLSRSYFREGVIDACTPFLYDDFNNLD